MDPLVKLTRLSGIAALGAVAALTLAGCAANEPSSNDAPANNDSNTESQAPAAGGSTGTIGATGSSAQAAAQAALVASFQMANPEASVNYESTGSGVGLTNFAEGASDFVGSDAAYTMDDLAAGFKGCATDSIVEIPTYISPVALAFNLPGIDSLNLDAETIANIFAGNITSWNDDAIAALNEGVELPELDITPVNRAEESGTTETFAKYLSATAPDVWTYEPSKEWPITGTESANGTQGVAQVLADAEGAIAYIDASQVPAGAGSVAVGLADGSFVPFSADAAAKLVSSATAEEGREAQDVVYDVDPAAASDGAYPIALVSYLIGCVDYGDAEKAQLVKDYFSFVASEEGQQISADEAGSAPISDELRTKIVAAIDTIVVD